MIYSVSRVNGTIGIENSGNPPETEARSPTRGTPISKLNTNIVTTPIASSGAGTNLVIFGAAQIRNIVNATRASVSSSVVPLIQPWPPSGVSTRNCSSCARPITIANPFTNPSITGCGTMRMNFPSRNIPASSWMMPIRTTVANKYSTP